MKSLTIRNKLIASFGTILLLLSAVGSFAYFRLADVEQDARNMEMDTQGVGRGSQIKDGFNEDFALTVQHLLRRDDSAKVHIETALQANRVELNGLLSEDESGVSDISDRQQHDALVAAVREYRAVQQAVIRPDVASGDVGERSASIDKRLSPALRSVLGAAKLIAERDVEARKDAAASMKEDLREIRLALLLSVALVLAVALVSGILLLRAIATPLSRLVTVLDAMRQGDFTQRMDMGGHDEFGVLADGFNRMADEVMGLVGHVQKSGIRVSTSMNEIAATSKQQQATATEVAATTTQIGATSREISATSKELVRTMNEVSVVAEHAAELASSGQFGLSQMGETMGQVMEAAGLINAKLAVLNEKAGNITQVVTTITKVADQTNLLSLNAAIEAEKAGEYGRGFAVVSSEIRRLADQTAVATFDIEEMVKEIQSAVSAGVMGMDKFSEEVRRGMRDMQEIGGKLSEVITQVQTMAPRFENVNEGMQAQATGAEQISEALLQLTETTQQTVESLSQSNSAIDDLSQVSGNLHDSISRFKLVA